ncbi:rod shape-determining protein MreD [Paenibacillus senegalimassiliensis]|uniref:rod shape-determining protein MreD n=1 Tax=Paenibacillus senegalimassiliensis TaxID=1737426 RepID=UPI0009EC161A|nr:rod shape-determining protein MreD [Paenibacillus senegalimassiliensis]
MSKRKMLLLLLVFVLFILEGTLIPWLVPGAWQTRITPHLVYVVILYFSVYEHRHTGLVLGLTFGILHDIVFYGALIGTYSFAMGLSGYLLGLLSRSQRAPLPLMMIIVLLGSLLLDSILFGTYSLFELTHQPYTWALTNHIIPNVFVQFIFALAIYVPLRRQLEIITRRRSPDEAA